jgi:hypothetical protein
MNGRESPKAWILDSVMPDGVIQSKRAGARPAPFILANVEPKPRLRPYRPPVLKGAAISVNYFFFFFFLAM